MAYSKQTWANDAAGATPLSASRLNHIEDGVGAAATSASNLSDLSSATIARTNLGLGDAATKNTGTTAGTVAAGDDSRFGGGGGGAVSSVAGRTGAVTLTSTDVGLGAVNNTADSAKPVSTAQAAANALAAAKSANLSDLTSATNARGNLGLGDAATRGVGTSSGTVAAGDDSRIVGALRSVNFGSTAGTSRGGSTGTVLWVGANGVTPTNTLSGDIVLNAAS